MAHVHQQNFRECKKLSCALHAHKNRADIPTREIKKRQRKEGVKKGRREKKHARKNWLVPAHGRFVGTNGQPACKQRPGRCHRSKEVLVNK